MGRTYLSILAIILLAAFLLADIVQGNWMLVPADLLLLGLWCSLLKNT